MNTPHSHEFILKITYNKISLKGIYRILRIIEMRLLLITFSENYENALLEISI